MASLNNLDNNSIMSTKNQIMVQMLQYQKKNLPYGMKLDVNDIKRIIENIDNSPFDENDCCIWNGYITNSNEKCKYINFYFKHRKIALHRLLYINYVGMLEDKNYLKFTCPNKGICCNINHIETCTTINGEFKVNPICKSHDNKNSGLQVIKLSGSNTNTDKKKLIVVFD